MERPKVYSKEHCVQCTATERKLNQLGVEFDQYDLESLPEMVEQFKAEGLLQAPIVESNGERWSGFRPDKLGEIALRMANG